MLNTTYRDDPQTFRLARLQTTRASVGSDSPDRSTVLQDLVSAYDASGNPTSVRDHAQHQGFTYDVLGRLVSATGRERATADAKATANWLSPDQFSAFCAGGDEGSAATARVVASGGERRGSVDGVDK